jgi:2-phosphosulfolactate phosphatase
VYDQTGFALRFDWGPAGAANVAPHCDVVVVVDVLSFSTAVEVAVGRGGTVIPLRWRDEAVVARAVSDGATHAGGYSAEPVAESVPSASGRPWSLAPTSLLDLPPGTQLAMPSPNGASITDAVAGTDVAVLAGCLRNAAAVARAARGLGTTVAVIAAGERWPDGSLRPSAEDLLGAGAILLRLSRLSPGPLSPEARAAVAAAQVDDLPTIVRDCASARELIARGHRDDVDFAAEIDVSQVVPTLRHGEFTAYPTQAHDA